MRIQQLHLSNNLIRHLEGIASFEHLSALSLQHNLIEDWHELWEVERKDLLLFLRVKGNPLTQDPSHHSHLVECFPALRKLDDLDITQRVKEVLQRAHLFTSRHLVQFLFYVDETLNFVDNAVHKFQAHREM